MANDDGYQPEARVTRNNPPKLFRVNDDACVIYNDKVYAGPAYPLQETTVNEGQDVLMDGNVAELFERENHGVIVQWDATGEFNKAHKNLLDYSHADEHGQYMDVTSHRQHLGEFHKATGSQMTEDQA